LPLAQRSGFLQHPTGELRRARDVFAGRKCLWSRELARQRTAGLARLLEILPVRGRARNSSAGIAFHFYRSARRQAAAYIPVEYRTAARTVKQPVGGGSVCRQPWSVVVRACLAGPVLQCADAG